MAVMLLEISDPDEAILVFGRCVSADALEESDDPGVTVVRFDLRLLKKVKLKNVVSNIEAAEIPGITEIEAYSA